MAPTTFGISRLKLIFHAFKTVRLVNAILHDARVHWFSKLRFVSCIGALGLFLLVPEVASDVTVGLVPVFGPLFDLVGIPTEGGLDWVTVVIVATGLLKFFPPQIVREHYVRIFGQVKQQRPEQLPTG